MSDLSTEVAALKAQLAVVMTTVEGKGIQITVPSIWVVHNPNRRSTWCSKSDCPLLGRKVSYDIVKDGEVDDIIMTGVSKEVADADDVKQKVKRIGSPTVKLHDLGVVASFTTKKKALDFVENYFKLNQMTITGDDDYELQISEIQVIS